MPVQPVSYKFPKSEKLCSKRIIEQVYEQGKKIKQYPFILNYLEVGDEFDMDAPVQLATAVPKRKVRLAVNRNRLKRQIREGYRLNKSELMADAIAQNKKLALFLIYIGKEPESTDFIEKKLILLLNALRVQITENTTHEN